MKSNYFASLGLMTLLFLSSCGNSGNDNLSADENAQDTSHKVINVSEQTIQDIVQSIPSPVEMASIIKSIDSEYKPAMLSKTEDISKYESQYAKAANIGIYSADLGYINIYEKSFASLSYLNALKTLADGIQVGQFFDIETLKRLSSNSKNMDSLLFLSTSSFNKMDNYLREHKRHELSILIISGAWIEGLYIASTINDQKKSKELAEEIASQKVNIDNLAIIMKMYNSLPYFDKLGREIDGLKKIYDGIQIVYEYKEPVTKEVNGELVIEEVSSSKVNVTDDQLKHIFSAVSSCRNMLRN